MSQPRPYTAHTRADGTVEVYLPGCVYVLTQAEAQKLVESLMDEVPIPEPGPEMTVGELLRKVGEER